MKPSELKIISESLIDTFNEAGKISIDLYKKGLNGGFTKKNIRVGNVASGGYSSKISYFEHLIEESKIRIHNKQNIYRIEKKDTLDQSNLGLQLQSFELTSECQLTCFERLFLEKAFQILKSFYFDSLNSIP